MSKEARESSSRTTGDVQPLGRVSKLSEDLDDGHLMMRVMDMQVDTLFLFCPSTGQALRWNRAFRKVSGYTNEEVAEMPFPASYFSPEDLVRAEACIQRALEEGSGTVELELLCKDGRSVPTEYQVSAILDKSRQPKYLSAVGRDLTLRKQMDRALVASEQQFRGYIDDLSAGVVAHAPDTTILYCNRRALEILGLTMDEMLGKTAIDEQWKFLNEDGTDMVFDDFPIKRALSSPVNLDNYMVGVVRPDRQFITWVVCSSFSVRDPEGDINHVLITFVDITERNQARAREQQLQERLFRAERMESVGMLAGGIAHDLNNLLCPNVLLPQTILEDLAGLTEEQCPAIGAIRENLAAMEQCSLGASEIIKDISMLSKSHVQSKVSLDLNAIIRQFLASKEYRDIQESSPEVRFFNVIAEGEQWISGTHSQLIRVLSNLVRNAALAIEGHGMVRITTKSVHLGQAVLGYEIIPAGDYIVLEISDTGIGIDAEALERVFEPFFTTRKQASRAGSGLGLAIVHAIVSHHGGSIDVQTAPREGTRFTLYFPTSDTAPQPLYENDEPMLRGSERILIVDDEPNQLLVARRALTPQGYQLTEVSNGHQALAIFEQAFTHGEESPFDLVLMDMQMEEGFDGLTTCKELLKLYPDQKVTIVSGDAGNQAAGEEAQQLGIDWLAKPYQRDDLCRAVRKRFD